MEHATSTKFCLSCHVMEDFGRSLYVDDPSYIPAMHFQNNRVPRDHACYTCHTDYTMFGGTLHSKASRRCAIVCVRYIWGRFRRPEIAFSLYDAVQ